MPELARCPSYQLHELPDAYAAQVAELDDATAKDHALEE
ncbi:MAG: hypothetical protein ACI91B_005093, partial [Planctomycetota bacterium]